MQPLPLLLRQTLRSSLSLVRTSTPTRTRTRTRTSTSTSPLSVRPISSSTKTPRLSTSTTASVCLRCQFRTQTRFYSSHDGKNRKEGEDALSAEKKKEEEGVSPERDEPLKTEEQPILMPGPTGTTEPSKDSAKPEQPEQDIKNAGGAAQADLPSQAEGRRSNFAKQFGDLMDKMQSNVFLAGRHLNDLTGYSSIEKLKQDIMAQEERVRETRALVRDAKEAYSAAINRRSTSQREVNELLQRKHGWTPTDLERFTSLYRSDHTNEVAESEAREALSVAEREAEEAAAGLSKNILARYHEEQIWSDKIRRMSTWGTWGLMGVNVLLFLIFQIAVEPWRRKRLVKGFEEKVMEALEKENGKAAEHSVAEKADAVKTVIETDLEEATVIPTLAPSTAIATEEPEPAPLEPLTEVEPTTAATIAEFSAGEEATHESAIAETAETETQPEEEQTPPSLTETAPSESWRRHFHDLFSDRRVALSQRDLTTIALESAAAGAAITGLLVAVFRPR